LDHSPNYRKFSSEEDLVREGLARSKAEVQRLSETNAALLGILTHDLQTPLMAAELFADKIKCENDESLRRLKTQLKETHTMLDDVREMAAAKSGKIRLDLRKVNIVMLIRYAIADLSERALEKGISFEFDDVRNVFVLADEFSVHKNVLYNVLSNALKFSYVGGKVKIEVSHDRDYVYVTVRDFGIGMPESLVRSLFDFQSVMTRKGTEGERGTGFGMPLVAFFMDKYGGEISVWSSQTSSKNEAKGTKVTLKFAAYS
jgi:signal transduction histidine kinase